MRWFSRLRRTATACAVTASFGLLSVLLTWPLPRYLRTRLLGDPAGDLGVYIWNIWIFRHEIVRHASLPFSTDHLFGEGITADFSLHNYAPIAGVLGAPLIGPLGVVAAFNVILLTFIALSGAGTFVLARRLGLGPVAAWCAGALFMGSPVLSARATAHFSLVIAVALPLFLWALLRALDTARVRDAAIVGAFVALAVYSDAYYGVYCVLMGAFVVTWRYTRVEQFAGRGANPWAARAVTAMIVFICVAIAWRVVMGPSAFVAGPFRIRLNTFYTPVLILTSAVALRAWLAWRPVVRLHDPDGRLPAMVRLGLVAVIACVIILLPQLIGIALRFINDLMPGTETYWRSSPRGLDLLAYVVPNPTHAWFGDRTRQWFTPSDPDAFPEMVAAFSIGSLAVVAAGAWCRVLPRLWVAFTGFFVWLSLGPFIHVAGVDTYVVGPWALLRYVPVIGMARTPARFSVVAALGMALLSGFAIDGLRRRRILPGWAWACTALLIAIELVPAPRQTYSAAVPEVYRLIAATTPVEDAARLLELPTGIRDGTSSLGNFNASSEFFQTSHRRPLVGGYLSRVSGRRKQEGRRAPMFGALMTLSEGGTLTSAQIDDALAGRERFLSRTCVRFVIINRARASTELQTFAVSALRLMLVHEDEQYALYTPADPPRCDPRPGKRRLLSPSSE